MTKPPPILETSDPDLQFFYKPRTLSALIVLLLSLIYYSINNQPLTYLDNIFRGLFVCCLVFLLISLLAFNNGPFIRPHPALWRIVTGTSVIYLMLITFLLFQDKTHVRMFLNNIDSRMGVDKMEKSYGENCALTPQNIYDQMDGFVVAHFLGWFFKGIILRDKWFCLVLSIMFEVMEYTLQHQLPNFNECWWDHWILDVTICNLSGTLLGLKFCEYFEMKQYYWRGLNEITTYKGKVKRSMQQFSPVEWTRFTWDTTKRFKNYVTVIFLLSMFLVCELNSFYLKYLLRIHPEHPINIYRICALLLFSIPATRELYEYVSNPKCKRFGLQAWLLIAIIVTELVIIYKYSDRYEYPSIWPSKNIIVMWVFIIAFIIVYPVYKFALPKLKNKKE